MFFLFLLSLYSSKIFTTPALNGLTLQFNVNYMYTVLLEVIMKCSVFMNVHPGKGRKVIGRLLLCKHNIFHQPSTLIVLFI